MPINRPSPSEITGVFGQKEFIHGILEGSSDCVKLLSLEGTLEFMSAGGQRVMEVDNVDKILGCPWPGFWPGEGGVAAQRAVEEAVAGKVSRFEGPAPTAKGSPRWWEVTVSPVNGPDGKPTMLLSISRDITARVESDKVRDLLLREMQHRVMNTLAMVSAITTQSLRTAPDLETARISIAHRFDALARTHALLQQKGVVRTTIRQIFREATEPFDGRPSRISIEGPELAVSGRAALALALTANELSTNATKYGALSSGAGRVAVQWNADNDADHFKLVWTETGGPAVSSPSRRGFGSRLIEHSMSGQLDGEAALTFAPEGLICVLSALLERMISD